MGVTTGTIASRPSKGVSRMATAAGRSDAVDGVLLFDKPVGVTSNAVLQRLKRLYFAAKAGHAGTLDPLASGLLPICFGEATKFSGDLLDADKAYHATIKLGRTTTTGDREGTIIEQCAADGVTDAAIARVLAGLTGEIEQVPPMYSALKHRGRPMYAYARAGITIDRAPRSVTIRRIEADARRGDELDIRVVCSKGTYIRVLAEDIGRALGVGASIQTLRRVALGTLDVSAAHTFEQLEQMTDAGRMDRLQAVDSMLLALPKVVLDRAQAIGFCHGRRVLRTDRNANGKVRVYGPDERFLGAGTLDGDQLTPLRLIAGLQR